MSGNVVQIQTARIKQAACNKKDEKISLSTYNLTATYSAISNLFYALFLCRIEWVPTSRIKHQPMLNLRFYSFLFQNQQCRLEEKCSFHNVLHVPLGNSLENLLMFPVSSLYLWLHHRWKSDLTLRSLTV